MWYKTRTLENVMDDFFLTSGMIDTFKTIKFSPNSKVEDLDNGYSIKIAIPGVDSKDVSVEIDSAKNELHIEFDGETTFVDKFKKVYEIPKTIDLDSIDVSVDLGVLSITMTRKEEASRKKLL